MKARVLVQRGLLGGPEAELEKSREANVQVCVAGAIDLNLDFKEALQMSEVRRDLPHITV